jgi:hypothetical protein
MPKREVIGFNLAGSDPCTLNTCCSGTGMLGEAGENRGRLRSLMMISYLLHVLYFEPRVRNAMRIK